MDITQGGQHKLRGSQSISTDLVLNQPCPLYYVRNKPYQKQYEKNNNKKNRWR